MSVLIRGMEMPKDCLTCRFLDYAKGYRCMIDQVLIGSLQKGERRDSCPLIPAADAIEELVAKNATTEWHSVEEDLPMCGQRCLVVMLRDDGETSIETAYCYVQNYGYWSDTGPRRKVTHWMPLPEPPKEGET